MSANRDLPILDELGLEFASLLADELGASRGAAAPSRERARLRRRPAPRPRRRQAHRVARRASVVLVLLCLVGGVALAARFGSDDERAPAHTSPAVLGHSPGGRWTISAYRDRGRLCLLLSAHAHGEVASRCDSALASGPLRSVSLIAGANRLVGGLAASPTSRVSVRVGDLTATARASDPIEPASARAAGLPRGTRWFVIAFPRPTAAPAALLGLDPRGRRLGPRQLDCSLGVVGSACREQIHDLARGASR